MTQTGNYSELSASDFDQLIQAQPGKNRRYTQLKSGKLEGAFTQAWLGQIQIFQEQLNVGARIQAAPPANLLPFTHITSASKNVKFCQQEIDSSNTITQATGGFWDVVFSEKLEYRSAVFDKEYFYQGYLDIKQQDVPQHFIQSKLTPTSFIKANHYSELIARSLTLLGRRPELFDKADVLRLMSGQILQAVIAALSEQDFTQVTLPKLKKRQLGVNKVIEFLQVHARDLPDIQTLCAIANLSERSLQYGFMEALGITPIQYLRMIRLNGAKGDLQSADDKQSKVVDIATNWGFVELGRFAKEYKTLFCELPSQTLSRGA